MPPRKPIEHLKAAGTYRADRHSRRREITAEGDLTTRPAPSHLSEAERDIWRQICNAAPARLLRNADMFLVEALCCAIAAHREARAARAATGLLLAPSRSDRAPVLNPLVGEVRRQARLVGELAGKLGLTPAARLTLLDGMPVERETIDPEFKKLFGNLRVVGGNRG